MLLRSAWCLIILMTGVPASAAEGVALSPWRTTVLPASTASPVEAGRGSAAQAVTTSTKTGSPAEAPGVGHALKGLASYYWHGEKTASGEPFDKTALTAAHPTLPFNTMVKVTRVGSGRSVVVRINDRGPFKPGRIIDVSERAAEILGFHSRGLANVELEVLP